MKKNDKELFWKVVKEMRRGRNRREIEDEYGVKERTARLWVVEARRMEEGGEVPISESQEKFHEDWGPKECIEELRRIVEKDTTKVISRNYFRNESQISESTWNRYFGTFEEFKRQAGVTLSRHAHQMEREIAKHASKDKQREMDKEKRGYEGKWLRPSGGRWQTVVVCNDVHDVECDPFWRRVFLDAIRRICPEKLILNGDIFDLPEFGKYGVDPREWDVVGRIKWVHEWLREIREVCPEAEIVFVEGNHEFRLLRHLTEATPALKVVLSDLHGFTVSKLLGLDEFEVNYVARMDLKAFTERDVKEELRKNYHVMWGCLMAHHFPEGKEMGVPGMNGHHHKFKAEAMYTNEFGASYWWQVGCGHRRAASYCAGEKWGMGFMVVHVDTVGRKVVFEPVEVRDYAVLGGKWYFREEDEGGN